MKTVRMLDTHEEIIGLSGHLLAVSGKNGNRKVSGTIFSISARTEMCFPRLYAMIFL